MWRSRSRPGRGRRIGWGLPWPCVRCRGLGVPDGVVSVPRAAGGGPTRSQSVTARALSRYFTHEGLSTYRHVTDQHTTCGTKVIVATQREAHYVTTYSVTPVTS
ncbi:transposase [Saccharopolyspora gloriosae]|uniref:transposase n=1 Tax=Saccharopolyspora gloriosae TaxID=455344 RepID=UPI00215DF6B2|nr:transposase [Saccharopolyspora gloriosae]